MDSYAKVGEDRDVLDPIARYLWNRALCKALTPSLHTFEVAVRNAVHGSMVKQENREDWFDIPGLLEARERLRIAEAKQYIAERQKEATPGRIVAELSLGFWTALFSSPYEAGIVHPVLARGMGKIPSEQKKRGRHFVAERLKEARDLRNRVFHHEAIWHFANLPFQHEMLGTFSSWPYPHFALICSLGDNFPAVHKGGCPPFRNEVQKVVSAYMAQESVKR